MFPRVGFVDDDSSYRVAGFETPKDQSKNNRVRRLTLACLVRVDEGLITEMQLSSVTTWWTAESGREETLTFDETKPAAACGLIDNGDSVV